jgi:hypothetical protein
VTKYQIAPLSQLFLRTHNSDYEPFVRFGGFALATNDYQ